MSRPLPPRASYQVFRPTTPGGVHDWRPGTGYEPGETRVRCVACGKTEIQLRMLRKHLAGATCKFVAAVEAERAQAKAEGFAACNCSLLPEGTKAARTVRAFAKRRGHELRHPKHVEEERWVVQWVQELDKLEGNMDYDVRRVCWAKADADAEWREALLAVLRIGNKNDVLEFLWGQRLVRRPVSALLQLLTCAAHDVLETYGSRPVMGDDDNAETPALRALRDALAWQAVKPGRDF